MKEIILKILEEVACGNTGTCQINLQSESARELIANKLEPEIEKYVQRAIEDVVVGVPENRCCGGNCHEG